MLLHAGNRMLFILFKYKNLKEIKYIDHSGGNLNARTMRGTLAQTLSMIVMYSYDFFKAAGRSPDDNRFTQNRWCSLQLHLSKWSDASFAISFSNSFTIIFFFIKTNQIIIISTFTSTSSIQFITFKVIRRFYQRYQRWMEWWSRLRLGESIY